MTKRLLIVLALPLAVFLAVMIYCHCERPGKGWMEKRYCQGHNGLEWLKILSPGATNPFQILHVTKAESSNVEFEIQLSYDLLEKNDFFGKGGLPHIYLNSFSEHAVSAYWSRASNGNLIAGCDLDGFVPGTNIISASLSIYQLVGAGPGINLRGPAYEFIMTNSSNRSEKQDYRSKFGE